MRLSLSMLLPVGALCVGACKADPPCVDEDGEEVAFCEVKVPGEPEPIIYCEGEQWADEDGCTSYGCGSDGEILPTANLCTQ